MKWLAVIFCILISAPMAIAQGAEHTITMFGEGMETIPADTAIVSISVDSGNENMTEAQSEVQTKMNHLLDLLKKAGVRDEDIMPGQSSGISSFQSSSNVRKTVNNATVWENSTQKATSLKRSTVIRLKTTDESRINQVLDAARSAGADAYVAAYSLSDSSKAVAEARKKAVANARENAAEVATETGGRLGKTLDISDYGYPGAAMANPYSRNSEMRMVDVISYVVVTYEFLI